MNILYYGLVAVALLALIVGGAGLFFGEMMAFVIVAGVLAVVGAGEADLEKAVPFMAVALLIPVGMNFFGLAATVPSLSLVDSNPDYPEINSRVDVKNGGVTASTVAPRTFRPVTVEIRNNDDIPLRIDGSLVYMWLGDCNDPSTVEKLERFVSSDTNICNKDQGDTFTVQSGFFNGMLQFGKKFLNQNQVGVTSHNPDDLNIYESTTNDWKDVIAVKYYEADESGEPVTLWTEQKCRNKALDSVDCSNVEENLRFEDAGYIWADKGVEVPSQYTLNVMFLTPTDDSLVNRLDFFTGAWVADATGISELSILERNDYRITAQKTKTVNVQTPETQLAVLIGAIGLLSVAGLLARQQGYVPI